MISGRCGLLTTLRYVSEFCKKRCSHSRCKTLHLTEGSSLSINSRPINRLDRKFPSLLPFLARMASTSKDTKKEHAKKNRLAYEKSPYLLQHATNPVDWYPWGHEAFEKARKEDKMIFLSVGYSTCHWCHVMERESFENKEVAQIMNHYFVNIKVDREERPDIDRIYMTFIQTKSGHGGWPMSVFLAPDLTPITGGTYFPPEDKYGQPGFKRLLLEVAKEWSERRSEILKAGSNILEILKQLVGEEKSTSQQSSESTSAEVPSPEASRLCVQQLARGYEPKFGGFGSRFDLHSPKFPQPVNFNFLFHMYAREPTGQLAQQCLDMCIYTLTKMAYGGIHDHVGQGFARYSIDGQWHVPHFEKMLYDQAQLLQSYADAFVATKNPFFSEIIDDIATYVTRDLRHKEGGFYSAEDADSLPTPDASAKREGAFYVWTYDEITSALTKEIPDGKQTKLHDLFCYHFNVTKSGNVRKYQDPHGELTGKNVLITYDGIEKTAEHFGLTIEDAKKYIKESCLILFEIRSKRPRPHLDDKILTAWNGLMLSGLSRAGAITGNKEYVKYATDAAKFIERYLFDQSKGTLLRSCYREGEVITQTSVPIQGFHDDYAFVVRGLLDLYEAGFDIHWLEFAAKLQDIQDRLFWDNENGGYFSTTSDDPNVILRMKDAHDGAEPSSNSIACGNLLRLAACLDRDEFRDKAARLLASFGESLLRMPAAFPELTSALLNYHDGTTQIYIAGKPAAEDTENLLRVINERMIPGRVLLLADHEQSDNILFRKNKVIGKMKSQNGRATAYVCRHRTCSLPVTTPEQLAALLDEKR